MQSSTINGKRKGVGRPPKFSEPATRIYVLVPISKIGAFRKAANKIISSYKK